MTTFQAGTMTTNTPFQYCTGIILTRIDDVKIVAYDLQSGHISTNRKTSSMSNWEGWIQAIAECDLTVLPNKESAEGDETQTNDMSYHHIPYIRLLTGGKGLLFGFKSGEAYAAQMRLSYFTGFSYRSKKNGIWSEWEDLCSKK